jgi:hypothetical protein
MADFLSDLSREQAVLSRKIADVLLRTLTTTPGIDKSVIALFAPDAARRPRTGPDKEAFEAALLAELGRAVKLSVTGFTELVAGLIVRSNDFKARPFPVPSPVAVAMLAAKSEVTPSVVAYAVAQMQTLASLPLLGRIENDRLIPDRAALEQWKSSAN